MLNIVIKKHCVGGWRGLKASVSCSEDHSRCGASWTVNWVVGDPKQETQAARRCGVLGGG